MFDSFMDETGVNADPEKQEFLHKIKIEMSPIVQFITKLGAKCPLNQQMLKGSNKGKLPYVSVLEDKFKMLVKQYLYTGDNLAPLKQLYALNGWSSDLSTK